MSAESAFDVHYEALNAQANRIRDLIIENSKLTRELTAYREGGLTEEIIRRHDGAIHLGNGCSIVRTEEAK